MLYELDSREDTEPKLYPHVVQFASGPHTALEKLGSYFLLGKCEPGLIKENADWPAEAMWGCEVYGLRNFGCIYLQAEPQEARRAANWGDLQDRSVQGRHNRVGQPGTVGSHDEGSRCERRELLSDRSGAEELHDIVVGEAVL